MPREHLSVVFAGSGGAGAMTAGTLFLRAAADAGYYGLMTQLFGPQVRGGESAALVQVAREPLDSQPDTYDVFVALDWEKVDQFAPEVPLGPESLILADPAAGPTPAILAGSGARVVPVALQPGKKTRGPSSANIVWAGMLAALAGIGEAQCGRALGRLLGSKSAEVQEANRAALARGRELAAGTGLDLTLAPPVARERWMITGNQAMALGALRGGLRFVACYPITPATDLVEWISPHLTALGGRIALAEDELASINMVLGASYGGVPSMTVTSGPGLSLMLETIGLAVISELPAVIINVMRVGPSTGIPSKTEQGDLDIAISGAHGDAPRVVMAPMSAADCLTTGEWAIYTAESLQTPVIVLSDQGIAQARTVIDAGVPRPAPRARKIAAGEGEPFQRFGLGGDPVSPMPPPGTPGHQWVAESLEHNEKGLPSSSAANHAAQLDKRARKLAEFDAGDLWGHCWGEGDTAIIAFGSSIGPARVAAGRLARAGESVRVIGLRLIAPLPRIQLAAALEGAHRVLVLEQNHGGQLYRHLLAAKIITPEARSLARPGPLPFRPDELVARFAKENVT